MTSKPYSETVFDFLSIMNVIREHAQVLKEMKTPKLGKTISIKAPSLPPD